VASKPTGETNLRHSRLGQYSFKPREKTEYTTRLISPRRSINALGAGLYKLHAHWALFGCTEAPEGTDCLTPLQVIRGAGFVADVALQEPVTVFSNEVTAEKST
jgi:hypothetical protein